jgi:hypothetical protein
MQRTTRRQNSNGDFDVAAAPPPKTFFQRHPVLKWTLIGLAIGLVAAAVAIACCATMGAGLVPFVAIGTMLGVSNAVAATAVGMSIVTAGTMAAFATVTGLFSAIVNKCRSPAPEPARYSNVSHNAILRPIASSATRTDSAYASRRANVRPATVSSSSMFSAPENGAVTSSAGVNASAVTSSSPRLVGNPF